MNNLYISLARQQPFVLGVFTDTTTALTAPTTGFNLDYTQVAITLVAK